LKSLQLLHEQVIQELGDRCQVSTTRDIETIASRIRHEGWSFLTITLPAFASDFQKALEQELVTDDLFSGFRRRGGLPRFLGGLLSLVFDRTSGRLLDEPSMDAVFAVRQITMLYGKIQLPCSDERVANAIDGYVKCEQEVREADARRTESDYRDFTRVSTLLWADALSNVDQKIYYEGVVPKHGPGATADRLKGNRKYDQLEWPRRLDEVFPAREYLIPNWHFNEVLDRVNFLEPGAERPVRVITVPKTLKTPRIIAIEPTAMQYMQQGIMEILVKELESNSRSFVGFTDQGPNQVLAREGSFYGELATLDLSEASDRVSNQLVRAMLQKHPHLFEAVDATRSRSADVPGHGVMRLAKFASMGSALCFPMEALVFSTLVFVGIQRKLNRLLTRADIESFRGKVRVYGDDIIVPVEYADSVSETLAHYGLKVNRGKSFWNGKFRESCGKDYYDGTDVTVVRVRRGLLTTQRNAQEVVSTVSLRNQLYKAGMWRTVKWLDAVVERVIPFPAVLETSPALGKVSFLGYETKRMHPHLQKPMVKAFKVRAVAPESNLQDHGALMKYFLKRGDQPHADAEHLERFGRPDAVDIKLGWVSAV
jgi:hypothetical protein